MGVSQFGAFLRTEYATRGGALLHMSQISNEKISDVHDHFQVGDRVDNLRVLIVDARKGEVGLSLRPPRPKRRGVESLEVGEEIEGRVVQVVSYGVFVDVGVNVNALLHVSRITGGRIDNIRLYVSALGRRWPRATYGMRRTGRPGRGARAIGTLNCPLLQRTASQLNEGDPVSVHVISTDVEKKTVAVSRLEK